MTGDTSGPPGDTRFFPRSGPFSLADIAAAIGAAAPEDEVERRFRGIAPLQNAGPDEVSFLDNRRYLPLLAATRAGAVILLPELAEKLPFGAIALKVPQPYLAWAKLGVLFHPPRAPVPGRHPAAIIDPSAVIDDTAEIGPYVVIEANATIGPRSVIGPHTVVGQGVAIGADCRIAAQVSIGYALIGDRVTLHPGVRIGQDGFGFAPSPQGFVPVAQLGRVIIHDDVDIGANSTVDRGSAQDTVIGAGTRIDNLVQIGHNTRTGQRCIIAGLAGVAGSATLGDHVTLAAQAGISGHVHLGDGAQIGPQAGVMSDVAAGARVLGSPAQPVNAFFREVAMLRRLSRDNAKSRRGSQAKDDPATP